MREISIGAAALLIGLVAGSVWPQGEIRDLERQVDELAGRECDSSPARDLSGMFYGRPFPEQREPEADPFEREEAIDGDAPDDSDEPGSEAPSGTDDRAEREDWDDLGREERVELMRTGMELRRRNARQALIDEVGADDQQLDDIDTTLDAMNATLGDIANDFVQRFEGGGRPTRRDMMVFGADALDVLITAEDGIAETLDDEQYETAPEQALDPLQYVDPAILEILQELER